MQELKPEGRLHFAISGVGGATPYNLDPKYARSTFQNMINGFTVLEADPKHLVIRFLTVDGKEPYADTLEK